MISLVSFSALASTIGMTLCEYHLVSVQQSWWNLSSTRHKIRDGHPDFLVTSSSWPAFLYAKYKCDPSDVEISLFQSKLLLKVNFFHLLAERVHYNFLFQAFRFVFTSPSSARNVKEDEHGDTPPPSKRLKKSSVATRSHVASLLGMTAVTGRSVAYIAIQVWATILGLPLANYISSQVRFALSSGCSWSESDGDFSYPDFYNNIVDFFEVTPGPQAKKRVDDLLKWWTLWVRAILVDSWFTRS
jgi:hypothetical protein